MLPLRRRGLTHITGIINGRLTATTAGLGDPIGVTLPGEATTVGETVGMTPGITDMVAGMILGIPAIMAGEAITDGVTHIMEAITVVGAILTTVATAVGDIPTTEDIILLMTAVMICQTDAG